MQALDLVHAVHKKFNVEIGVSTLPSPSHLVAMFNLIPGLEIIVVVTLAFCPR